MNQNKLLVAVSAVLCAPVLAGQAAPIEIQSQPLSKALRDFAAQSGFQVLFPDNAAFDGVQSTAVQGSVSPQLALKKLLAGSGLDFEYVNARTVAIRVASHSDDAGPSRLGYLGSDEQPDVAPAGGGDTSDSHRPASAAGLPEVLVRGSRSLNADIERTRDDVRPYVVIDRKTIERSGARDVNELLNQRLTMSYVPHPTMQTPNAGTTIGGSSSIALRGLADSETLVLVDGRRTIARKSQLTEYQSDLSSIPLSAIERIEVLPASAAGIYGGNATGGVVNVILRREYSGVEADIGYGGTLDSGAENKHASLAGGLALAPLHSSLSFNGSYSRIEPLTLGDRDFVVDRRKAVDAARFNRDPNAYYNFGAAPLGSTANITSRKIGNVAPALVFKPQYGGASLNVPITSLPLGYRGLSNDGAAPLATSAGHFNLDLAPSNQTGSGRFASLIGTPNVGSASVTLRTDISEKLSSFVEVSASRSDYFFYGSPISAQFLIPASSANNPFQQNIIVNAPLQVQHSVISNRTDEGRVLVGFNAKLTQDWSAALDYSVSNSTAEQTYASSFLTTAATQAVASGAINVLQDPAGYTSALMAFATPANTVSPTHSRFNDTSLRIGGPILQMPAGGVVLTTVLEDRRQNYGEFRTTAYRANGNSASAVFSDGFSKADSLYSELRIPLSSEMNPLFGIRSAELQVAGRYEKYDLTASYLLSDEGDQAAKGNFHSVDPTVGLRVEPVEDLVFRVSYGTGFLPPYLGQLQPSLPADLDAQSLNLTDPKRGNEPVIGNGGVLTTLVGGNPALRPEQSQSLSMGAILKPRVIPNFRLSLDWTRIRKKDNILSADVVQQTVNDEDLISGAITRAAPVAGDPYQVGAIIGIDSRLRNAAHSLSESYDISLDYSVATSKFGAWEFSATGTKLVHNNVQLTILSAPQEKTGTVESPAWAANATISWGWRDMTVSWTTRYLDSYWVLASHAFYVPQNSDHLPSETYHNLLLEYDFGKQPRSSGVLSNLAVRFGVNNLFNTAPRFSTVGPNFYDSWGDPKMQNYFVSLRKTFSK